MAILVALGGSWAPLGVSAVGIDRPGRAGHGLRPESAPEVGSARLHGRAGGAMAKVRVGVAALVGAVFALLGAVPAAAHTVGGVGATNFHTTLSALTPAMPGVTLRVIENGS